MEKKLTEEMLAAFEMLANRAILAANYIENKGDSREAANIRMTVSQARSVMPSFSKER